MRDQDIEILLITTRKKGRWSVPKGWPIKQRPPHEMAATEAYEEAGVRGSISVMRIGQFKKRRLRKQKPVLCEVTIYPLKVKRLKGNWPEKHQRSRAWVTPRKAAKLVRKPGLRRAIKAFDSGSINSDAGALLLRETDRAIGLGSRLAPMTGVVRT